VKYRTTKLSNHLISCQRRRPNSWSHPPNNLIRPDLKSTGYQSFLVSTLSLDRTNDPTMGNLFGSLGRPGNNQGATTESIPVVRDKATESKKEAGCYNSSGNSFVQACKKLVIRKIIKSTYMQGVHFTALWFRCSCSGNCQHNHAYQIIRLQSSDTQTCQFLPTHASPLKVTTVYALPYDTRDMLLFSASV